MAPGVYTARIRDPKCFVADSGTRGFEVTFEDEVSKGTIRDSQYVTAKTLPYLRYRIEAAGADLPSGDWEPDEDDPKFAAMVRSLEGRRVKILVGMEPDHKDPSKEWARVKEWEKPDGGNAGGLPADDDIPF
jgi:hypothetical protein